MKTLILTLSLLTAISQVDAPRITSEDMEPLIGVKWEGELTYINGSDKAAVAIPAALSVSRQGEQQYLFAFSYPHEPDANRDTLLTIEDGGTVFGGEKVMSKERLEDGSLKVTTTETGEDDGREAVFRFTYVIGPSRFSTRKEVTYVGEEGAFFGSGYTFENKGNSE